jgi:ADP-ribose pyrophosphatase YjhB (NUDIX family)
MRPAGVEGRHYPVCSVCDFVFYLNPKIVVGTLPRRDGRVLLLRRDIEPARGLWVFPGGYVDLGESVEEAAHRETREEVNVEVRLDGLLGVYSFSHSPSAIIVYLASVVRGEPRSGPEAQEVRWVGPDEIPWTDLAFPSTRAVLSDWVRSLGRTD